MILDNTHCPICSEKIYTGDLVEVEQVENNNVGFHYSCKHPREDKIVGWVEFK